MARRMARLLGAALLTGLLVSSTTAAPPSEAGVVYEANLQCGDLMAADPGAGCTSDQLTRAAGWVQAHIDGDRRERARGHAHGAQRRRVARLVRPHRRGAPVCVEPAA